MNGFQMLFWAAVYNAYNRVVHPSRRWELDCKFCDTTHRARSHNMALLKDSLHVHFTEDEHHPDGPEDFDGDWSNFEDHEPELVTGGGDA